MTTNVVCDTGAVRMTFDNEADWLAERRKSIGASESPDVLGCGFADGGPSKVWARKRLGDDHCDSELLAIGRIMEPAIRNAVRELRELDVSDPEGREIFRNPQFPWLHASPDGFVHEEYATGVLEAKNVSGWNHAEWSDGNVPLRVQVQAQQQLLCTGLGFAYVAGLVGGNKLVCVRLERDDRFIDAMLPVLSGFWHNYVECNVIPPDDPQVIAEVIRRLHPDDNGETVELSAAVDHLLDELEVQKEVVKQAKDLEQRLKNEIEIAIGDATYGQLPSGRVVSWKSQTRKEYVCKSSTFRVLRTHAAHPEKKGR